MRDPHVVSLSYRLVLAERVTYSVKAEPVEAATDAFRVRLVRDSLHVEMLDHHPDEHDARAAAEPYIRAWEVDHALRAGGDPEFRFEFVAAEVVDRDPPPPGTPQTVSVSGIPSAERFGSGTVVVERSDLPAPPSSFAVDLDVETLWARWRAYREGREPLQSMAYFSLTVLELHGGRAGAAARLGVAQTVLNTLGKFVSERGDAATARKATGAALPLTPTAAAWIEAVVLALIRRAGEVAADPAAAAKQLTMTDFPAP
jgi:hypothetical protein